MNNKPTKSICTGLTFPDNKVVSGHLQVILSRSQPSMPFTFPVSFTWNLKNTDTLEIYRKHESCSYSFANAFESLQSCTKPSISWKKTRTQEKRVHMPWDILQRCTSHTEVSAKIQTHTNTPEIFLRIQYQGAGRKFSPYLGNIPGVAQNMYFLQAHKHIYSTLHLTCIRLLYRLYMYIYIYIYIYIYTDISSVLWSSHKSFIHYLQGLLH